MSPTTPHSRSGTEPAAVILSVLSSKELQDEAQSDRFPKWNSLALLRWLNLPTLDAAFIRPFTSRIAIEEIVASFTLGRNWDRLLVRSDGGRETADYHRGGDSLPFRRAIAVAARQSLAGRGVILSEPTNRFANKLSVSIGGDCSGEFWIETLGAGFDVSDLARGGVPPEYVFKGSVKGWTEYAEPTWDSSRPEQTGVTRAERIQIRLTNIGRAMLPALGVPVQDPMHDAAQWLRAHGYTALWSECSVSPSRAMLRRWFDDFFLVAHAWLRQRNWRVLALSGSDLGDGRFIYWDVVDSGTKWANSSLRAHDALNQRGR